MATVPVRISREMRDIIDRRQKQLAEHGVCLSKEDVTVVLAVQLMNDGKCPPIIINEIKSRQGMRVEHKHKVGDLWDMELKDFLNRELKVKNGYLVIE